MKRRFALSLLAPLLGPLMTYSLPAAAGPECTTAEKTQWQDATAFQDALRAEGYEIKKFKITSGNCYEIYGWDKDRKKVEIYFDPVSGKPVKSRIED
jgi:hypothetical protein